MGARCELFQSLRVTPQVRRDGENFLSLVGVDGEEECSALGKGSAIARHLFK
jgi:hypothetical protein